jgi:osmotically-inducible protein OsmY
MMRIWLGLVLAIAAMPLVQSCVPLVVTGAGAAVVMAADRRSTGTYIDDEGIELTALGRLHDIPDVHVNATSFNRRVLLTGEVPTDDLRKRVQQAIRTISNVREVIDEMQLAGASSLASRGSDSLITSSVKARMLDNKSFSVNHIKVVTEAGVVYLMGLVTSAEADGAVEVARTTSGVNRVVKVFEPLS